MKLIPMDKCLATCEHLQKMVENEGVQIDVSFDVTQEDFYGIVAMLKLEVNDAGYSTSWNRCSYWTPKEGKRLDVSFYTNVDE